MKRPRPPKITGGCKIELRGVPHGWRSPGGSWGPGWSRQGRSEIAPGRLLGSSWRLVSPSSGALGASWGRLRGPQEASGGSRGSSGRPFLDGYCGGGAQEPGKSTNVDDFLYFGEQVVALMFGLFFLPCDAASGEGKFENHENTLVFVGRNAFARFSRTMRRT